MYARLAIACLLLSTSLVWSQTEDTRRQTKPARTATVIDVTGLRVEKTESESSSASATSTMPGSTPATLIPITVERSPVSTPLLTTESRPAANRNPVRVEQKIEQAPAAEREVQPLSVTIPVPIPVVKSEPQPAIQSPVVTIPVAKEVTEPDKTEVVNTEPSVISVPKVTPVIVTPKQNTGNKIQRSGSLLNQSFPVSTTLKTKKKKLPALRQLLITAIDFKAAEQQRKQLSAMGLKISGRKNLSALGIVLSTYKVPEAMDIGQTERDIKKQFPAAIIEKNQRYRLLASQKKSYGQSMVGLNIPSQCLAPARIAMLDSAINTELSVFDNKRVQFHDVTGKTKLPKQHGSSVANLLVSDNTAYPGLLPKAQLDAINVFAYDYENKPETRTDWLLKGLNIVAGLDPLPSAVNMSFGGEESLLLKILLDRLSKKMVFLAAAGNDGNDQLVYPAAYTSVYAVGAVNAKGRRYRQSNYGEHIQLNAPGEDIWTLNGKGQGYYATGTSFAAPFATAAMAMVIYQGGSAAEYLAALNKEGVIDFRRLCP